MSRVFSILAVILGLGFFLFLFFSITLSISASLRSTEAAPAASEQHFAVYLPSFDTQFFRDLQRGALDAGSVVGAALSFHAIDREDSGFEYAAGSGFRGIAVYPYGNQTALDQGLARIAEAGIPLVFIENELGFAAPAFFIGTNGYDTGKALGRITQTIEEPNLEVYLIYSQKNPGILSDANLVEMGFNEVVGGPERGSGWFQTRQTGLNPLDAEKLSYEIVEESPQNSLIILTDQSDTLVAAQAIVDLNLVGHVRLIGFGDNEVIRDYIQKGILEGSVVRNPYRIGYAAVMALQEISLNGYTSSYVNTGVQVLLPENLAAATGGQRF